MLELFRRLAVRLPFARFRRYVQPTFGWRGWVEVFGVPVAFVGMDGRYLYRW